METNQLSVITMQDYDNATTESEKRSIAQGFEECRNKTTEMNIKFLAENKALKLELETWKTSDASKEESSIKYYNEAKNLKYEIEGLKENNKFLQKAFCGIRNTCDCSDIANPEEYYYKKQLKIDSQNNHEAEAESKQKE